MELNRRCRWHFPLAGAEELARAGGTIAHEVLTRFGQRLPRLYVAGGEVESVASRFLPGGRR
jgi:hypothetical protein